MNKHLKRFLSVGLAAVVLSTATLPASAASVTDFKDVSADAWYYNAVDYAASYGLFSGTGKNTFSPDTGMTRGMFVTVLGRKSGVPDTDPASTSFSDVKTTDWFAPYVEWAAANKIVSGTGNGKFTPNDKISRQQMATILYRYAQQTGNDTSVDPSIFNAFPDKANVAGYAVQGMRWAASHGIIKGSGGKLDPAGTATRAQVAQVFLNAKDVLVKTEIVETLDTEIPKIELTDEQRAQLTSEQDPDELLRQILAGTSAKWDTSIAGTEFYDISIMTIGYVNDGIGTTKHAVFNALEYLNNTGADRFYIYAWEIPGSTFWNGVPSRGLSIRFTIPDRQDSQLMAEAKRLISQEFPNAKFEKMAIGHGWRGYMRADNELSLQENARRVADQEIRYLSEWYENGDSFTYWLSEPEPGKFYFFY